MGLNVQEEDNSRDLFAVITKYKDVLVALWIILAILSASVFCRSNTNLLFICASIFFFSFFGYKLLDSWKFSIVFTLIFMLFTGFFKWQKQMVGDYLLAWLGVMAFLIFSIIIKNVKEGCKRRICVIVLCVVILSAAVVGCIASSFNPESVAGAYIHSAYSTIKGVWIYSPFLLVLSVLFLLVTLTRKFKPLVFLIKKFGEYAILFFAILLSELLYASFAPVYSEYYMGSTVLIQVFIIYCDYILLTMWWHPGYYFNTEEEGSHRFDVFADDYRSIHTDNVKGLSGESSDYFTEYKLKEIESNLMDGCSFLDFGCGDGNTGKFFSEIYKNMNYYGVDVSEESIKKAKSLNLPNCVYEVYDGTHLPYEDDKFDVIFIACVLHHIPVESRINVLKECKRVLKKTGKLFIFEHNTWNILTCNVVDKCPFDEDAILLSPLDAYIYVKTAGYRKSKLRFTLFVPRKGIFNKAVKLEKYMKWCPIGAQYYFECRK